ncbi:hypothetical protein DSCO28_73310 (plasmid) [Desulfosarcina ovata subsp. sediminis]|uniref:Uncharacterized protein n=1 Tax=Desulfosarcina ovata subsp. sediminis TaxID=885957 RepID=A0A5K8A2F2_9BACT|nr:hypothetical protein [Desulfosarcina ovata]BBO86765.1 hypothetical protein DSCO28_73310 [Desulfosarcina ovata subsp. sediminis]
MNKALMLAAILWLGLATAINAAELAPTCNFTDTQKEYYEAHPEAAGLIESNPEVAQQIAFLRQTALMESSDGENYQRELIKLQRLIKAHLIELMIEDGIDPESGGK